MTNFFFILLLAFALSADTFSLSLALGTTLPKLKEKLKLSFLVGSMHFIMPLLGELLGQRIIVIFSLNSNKFLGGILVFIAFNLFLEMKNEKEIKPFTYTLFHLFLFSFGVSIDAFSCGLGINKNSLLLSVTLFSLVSFLLTYLGLALGNLAYQHLNTKANKIGFLLLIALGIYHLCK